MPKRRFSWLTLAVLCAILAPRSSVVAATWQTNGEPLAPTDSLQVGPVIASDGAGGAYVAWQEYRNGWGIHMQRLMANGALAPGWPVSGRLVGAGFRDPVMVADANRGAFVAGSTSRDVAWWYVTSGGGVGAGPLPPVTTVRPADIEKLDPTGLPTLLHDGAAGAFLAWTQGGRLDHDVRVVHLRPPGIAPGWPGQVSVGYGGGQTLCSDDSGGVLIAWGTGVVVRRVRADGSFSPDWPPYVAIPGQYDADAPGLVSDDAGGALVFWLDRRAGFAQVFAQHLTARNAIAPGWPGDGLRISSGPSAAGIVRFYAAYGVSYSSVAPDGAGGGFVAWSEARGDTSDVYVQHVNPDGSLAAGWPADGLPVCTAAGTQWLPALSADGAGGVLVSWQDHRSGTEWDVYAQHVSGAGVSAWAANGVPVCGSGGDQVAAGIVPDGSGGAILGWQDARCGAAQIFGSHVLADGTLPGGPEVQAIALAATSGSADAGTIALTWHVTKGTLGAFVPSVYRRQGDGPWSPAGTASVDASGELAFSDTGALEGCSYGYVLGVSNCGFEQRMGEIWVDTPIGHGFNPFAASEQEAEADSGLVRLRWQITGGKGVQATLARRDSCSDWVTIGTPVADDSGQILYLDRSPLFADHRHYYRLVARACGTDHDLGILDVVPRRGFAATTVAFTNALMDTTSAAILWEETVGPPALGHVYRRDSTEDWSWRGRVTPRVRLFEFRDTGLRPGHRYEYRLLIMSCGVGTWSDPTALTTTAPGSPPVHVDGHPHLALRATRPNPATDRLAVDLTLENAGPATLDLIDLGGRRVLHREVSGLGSGEHSFQLDEFPRLRSGIYLLRLSQAGATFTRRVTIVH